MTLMKASVLPCYCASLRRAARVVSRLYDDALRPTGLTTTQFTVLELLSRAGSARIMDIERMLGADQTTVTRNLAGMAREGWIKGQVGREDRRERHWRLTASGRALHRRALPAWRSAQRSFENVRGGVSMNALRTQLAMLVAGVSHSRRSR